MKTPTMYALGKLYCALPIDDDGGMAIGIRLETSTEILRFKLDSKSLDWLLNHLLDNLPFPKIFGDAQIPCMDDSSAAECRAKCKIAGRCFSRIISPKVITVQAGDELVPIPGNSRPTNPGLECPSKMIHVEPPQTEGNK